MTEASTVLAPLSLIVFDLVLVHLVTDDADLLVAVDDTAHRRRGKKVLGAGWIHDGSGPSRNKLAFRTVGSSASSCGCRFSPDR